MPVYDEEKKSGVDPSTPIGGAAGANYGSRNLEKAENSESVLGANKENNTEVQALSNKLENNNLYNPTPSNGFNLGKKEKGSRGLKANRKKIAIAGGIVGAILSAFMLFITTYIPLQVADIKEKFRGAYGGTQEATLTNRKMRVYRRAYFFRDDGAFDGYKQRGMFGFLKNRSSTKLVTDLEGKGFKVKPQLDVDGKWTGKFNDIEYKGKSIAGADSSLWERRSAIRGALAEEYPTRGFMWRSRQARKLYNRFGLNRSNWWDDNAATRKLDSVEAKFRSKVRSAMKRNGPLDVTAKAPDAEKDSDGNVKDPDADAANKKLATDGKAEIDSGAKAAADADPSLRTPPIDADEVTDDLKDSVGDVGKTSVISNVSLTEVVEVACSGMQTLTQIEKGSRTIKRLQLIKGFGVYMSLIDGVRTGHVKSKDVGAFMNLMTSKDPKTGKNAYQSGGWLWASKGKGKEPKYGNIYNTGGGATGKINSFRTTAQSVLGGPKAVETTCDTVNNPFVQIATAAGSIALAIGTWGGSAVASKAASTAVKAALKISLKLIISYYAMPLITNLVAGTLIHGWEKGERFGDMLSSAAGSTHYAQGGQLGMRPLKKPEKKALMEEYDGIIQDELSQKPLYARLFDLNSPYSMVGKIAINSPKNPSEFASLALSPLKMFTGKALAEEDGYQCNDENIVNNNIATDPFCNPILGETNLDSIDPVDNMKWMLDSGHVDDNGEPNSEEYKKYVSECFENNNIETLVSFADYTSSFSDKCYSSGSGDLYKKFRAYRIDFGLVNCIDKELDQGHCDENATTITDGTTADGTADNTDGTGNTGSGSQIGTQPVKAEGLSCNGYWRLAEKDKAYGKPLALNEAGRPVKAYQVNYSQKVKEACEQRKTECESGNMPYTQKGLCEAFKYDGTWYGAYYWTDYKDPNKTKYWDSAKTIEWYGIKALGNAEHSPEKWASNWKPGLNGNNFLGCTGNTTMSVFNAYDKTIDGSEFMYPSSKGKFRKISSPQDLQPGDYIWNTAKTHWMIVASKVNSDKLVIYESSGYGNTIHFSEISYSKTMLPDGLAVRWNKEPPK